MILFLDFDGVLHPLFTRPDLPPEESLFFRVRMVAMRQSFEIGGKSDFSGGKFYQ